MTLSGSGFGSKATVEPLFFETYEDHAAGTGGVAAGFDSVVNAAGDGSADANVSTERAHSGTKSLKNVWSGGDVFQCLKLALSGGLDLYGAFWLYWETSGTQNTNLHIFKLIRAGANADYSGVPKANVTIRPDNDQGGIITATDQQYQDGVTGNAVNMAGNQPDRDGWHFVEYRYRFSTPGTADGFWKYMVDGVLGNDISNPVATRASGITDELAWFFLLNGVDQRGDALTYDLFMDETLVDTTFARVIATDAETYANSTTWAPQEPTSWSGTEIEIADPNWSDFTPGATVYFHVFDEDDNHVSAHSEVVP